MAQVSSLPSPVSDAEPLVRVQGVSKKFCLSLKKSLWYGLKDMGNELLGRRHGGHGGLRPKEFWAVHDVSFELRRGECLGLIGRNGAGKTTLLKMLNGLIKPDAGRIEMRGRVGALIALGAGFNPVLTGRENIYVNASVVGLSRMEIDQRFDEIVDFAELAEFIDMPVQSYSSGMAVRLGFAIAASVQPDVLLLDEVFAVGDLGFQFKCFRRLGELLKNAAVIFVSHHMGHVANNSSKIMWLDRGRIRMLSDDCPSVIQAYMGLFKSESRFQAGSGAAEITDVRIVPTCRPDTPGKLRHGEDVAVEFTVVFKNEEPAAWIHINFLDHGGGTVAQCMSPVQNFYLQNKKTPQRVRMILPKLPLNSGTYSLYILLGGPHEHWAVHYGICPFSVAGSHIGFFPIQPVVDWTAD